MAKQKTGFTMEQHVTTGELLRKMQRDLTRLHIEVANHYSISGKRAKRVLAKLGTMEKSLSAVRSELEELMAEQYPDEWETTVYYGRATE